MTYSKLGNIKGPQGRRGPNMTGGATQPPAVDDSVLEGDLWLDLTTGDVYRATDPWTKDGSWRTWGTVLWKVDDNVLMVQPAEGDTGTLGTEPWSEDDDGWSNSSNNPSMASITSVRSKGGIAVNANDIVLFANFTSLTDISALSGWGTSGVTAMTAMFAGCTSLANLSPLSNWDTSGVTSVRGMFSGCTFLTDISALSGWNVSGVTDMCGMFQGCTSLTDISPISGWDTSGVTDMSAMFFGCTSLANLSPISGWNASGVTNMSNMFSDCTIERVGIPSLAHGGKNFVSKFESANVVANMNTTMLTNTTTHETMSANQILTDMDSNQSKYATGTIWTL